MIQLNDLQFAYPQSGFQLEISALDIAAGEKVAVVGPSGSGKTTLLNLISGICVPDRGSVHVHGQQVGAMSDAARRSFRVQTIGSIFQQFELVEYLTVRENILLPYWINRSLVLDHAVRERAAELAASTGIEDKLHRRVTRLSQGEQQRVAICRALLTRPNLILADEPTGNLDPRNKKRILQLLFDQCLEGEITLVTVTHDVNILEGFDRTIDFEQFRIEENGGGP
ncbi:MAG: ABC transporter ATP-binding protein [Pirellulaceae bacterium]|nr:ABC transporter ATP-binding protein [Pirellulaceae bacterium]